MSNFLRGWVLGVGCLMILSNFLRGWVLGIVYWEFGDGCLVFGVGCWLSTVKASYFSKARAP